MNVIFGIISLSLALWSYFWSTELYIYDLLFETDVGRFDGIRLFSSCAWAEVLSAKLFDKHLVHLEY